MLILEKNGFDARVLSYFRGILCHPSIFYPKKRFHIIKRSFHHDVSDFSLSFLLPRFIFLLKFNFAFSFVIYIIFWSIFFFSQLDELNLYFTPFIYFRYRNLSSLSSFLFRYLCFTVYSFVTSRSISSMCDLRFSFIRLMNFPLCYLYGLYFFSLDLLFFLISFTFRLAYISCNGFFIARKFWKWRWFLRQNISRNRS